MSKNRLTSLFPVRFATWLLVLLLLVCVSALPALADESSDAVSTEATESVSAEVSAEASTEASTDASAAESEESETSETEASEASKAASETASEAGSTAVAVSDTSAPGEEESGSNIPWKLIITVAVIVILVAVLFILAKTNSKLGQKIAKFFKDYKSELAKVSWMPRNELVRSTLVVLVVLLVAAVAIGLLDFAFSSLVKLLSSIG